ncbi:helix-turn-helix domain-containing protein [Polynucleobacter sp. AP-Melu-500A-A1]|uniref:helix-turn-helix domain-containing protein n=1 Tax=Polynucleobacter sp. AP-Melu-500A-A1 TaxID=2576929 RepID=UPI001C0AD4CC|nr:helix-turn-helix domain-containing protein [Polynucleobacter sp. AP-Melu-500A-A1]
MNKSFKLPEIRKEAFIQARESLGLSTKELAAKACLSKPQIEQIENGEMGSFYSAQIKYTAAKKVASILQLNEDQAFDFAQVDPLMKEVATAAPTKKITEAPVKAIPIETATPVAKPQLAVELQDFVVEKGSNKTPSTNSSQKKLILLLSLAAAVVFSVINLRPLFFPEQPKEELVVVQEVAPVEPPPVSDPPVAEEKAISPMPVVAAASPAVTTDCPPAESAPTTYKSDAPKKPGDLVYVLSKTAQMVCVIDVLGKVQSKQLEPGVGVSVYGKAPFKVLTAGLDQVDLYYQGSKVRPSNPTGKTIVLESAEFPQPLAPTDSQLR